MQSPEAIVLLATLLIVKHFLADGPLQTEFQLTNKGQFLHLGGCLHAATHAALTALSIAFCFWVFSIGPATFIGKAFAIGAIGVFEFALHYTIDWLKCFYERSGDWSEPRVAANGERALVIKNSMFFHAFLADQMLHSMTYLAIVCMVSSLA